MINPPGWSWMDAAKGGGLMDEEHPVRRVKGIHEIRFDGLSDLMLRAHGCSVLDVGCNRGHVLWDFAINGARLTHGCDVDGASMHCARMWFSEHPNLASQFEVVDLRDGVDGMTAAFGDQRYDIVLLLAVLHKLRRIMQPQPLVDLIKHLGGRAQTYFGWTGYPEELDDMDRTLGAAGLQRVHTSALMYPDRPAAIWKRA